MRNNEKEIPRHQPPKGSKTQNQELLYDPNVLTPSHAEQAQTLVSKMATATLCTMSIEPAGYPYGSFVTYAIYEGNPIFLMLFFTILIHFLIKFLLFDSAIILIFGSVPDFLTKILPLFFINELAFFTAFIQIL